MSNPPSHIEDIYVKLLKLGWAVEECQLLGSNLSITIYDPTLDPEQREYWVKTGNTLDGGLLRPPSWDKVASYLLTPGLQNCKYTNRKKSK